MKRFFSSTLMTLSWLLLVPAMLLSMFLLVTQDAARYGRIQDRYVNEAVTGISDADRYRLNEGLADYLRGKRAELDMTATVYGTEQVAFGESERLHMVDVLGLFDLARAVRLYTGTAGVLLMIAALAMEQKKRTRRLLHTYIAVLIAWGLMIFGFVMWVQQDFNRAFIAFHHLLFRNGLWLMDPATDLMIRMLPEEFFRDMAFESLLAMIPALLLPAIVLGAVRTMQIRRMKRSEADLRRTK